MPEVRLITPITRQSTKKMQVAAYCRVSSNSADQLNSYAAQIRAYKKCIGARDDWELVDIFADEGLTGMKSETRDEFQRMIRMCELKQIDLIITKSISRFARNTKDALAFALLTIPTLRCNYKSTVHGQLQRAWQVPPDLPLSAANE